MISNVNNNYKSIYKYFDFTKVKFLKYNELRKEVKHCGINKICEYMEKRKSNWPSNPDRHYKEWVNWPHLFGREKIEFLKYNELRKEAKHCGINNMYEYMEKRKSNWPSNPHQHYKEWIDWLHFFGREKTKLLKYNEIRKEIKKYNINSKKEYLEKRKSNWPRRPDRHYKEWFDWYHLFGREKTKFLKYNELRKEVKKHNINSQKEYLEKRKSNWPSNPQKYYKEWIDWLHLFGREKTKFLKYNELRKEVKKYNINSQKEYLEKRKSNWPSKPYRHYKEWIDWHHFLGKEKPSR